MITAKKPLLLSITPLSKNYVTRPLAEDKTLLDFFNEFILESSKINGWAEGTLRRFGVVKNHITGFNSAPTFDSFNKDGLRAYADYLMNDKDMRNVSVSKQISLLKWFLRWATENEYNTCTDFEKFKLRLKNAEKRVIFLTWDELMTVYNFNIPDSKKYLDRVRDVFCFCCFTSLRYSDAYNLKVSDIIGDSLHITTVKTSDSLIIELNKYSRTILNKYTDIPYKDNKALPVISNQKMNAYLKEIGDVCGIDKNLTYHLARHVSFCFLL